MTEHHDFADLDTFTVGAVGRPGQRVFFLQARRGGEWVTVKCEKQQAAALAEHLGKLLSDLPAPEAKPLDAAMQLVEAVDAAFVLGPVGLGYDRLNDRVLVQLEEMFEVDDEGNPIDEEADRGTVRVHLTRDQAHAFCRHTGVVVAAGRPPCRWCARPVDPDGHACPRMN